MNCDVSEVQSDEPIKNEKEEDDPKISKSKLKNKSQNSNDDSHMEPEFAETPEKNKRNLK